MSVLPTHRAGLHQALAATARHICTAPGRSPVSQGPGREMARLPEQQCARPNGNRRHARRVTKGVAYRASAALSRGSVVVSEHVDVDGMSRWDPTYTPDLWSVSGPSLARAPADRRGTPHAHSRCMRLRRRLDQRWLRGRRLLQIFWNQGRERGSSPPPEPPGHPRATSGSSGQPLGHHQSLPEPARVHQSSRPPHPRRHPTSWPGRFSQNWAISFTVPSYPRPSFIYCSPAYADRVRQAPRPNPRPPPSGSRAYRPGQAFSKPKLAAS
ncbi:hypothetical protein EDB80DRAFT_373360 [Ilyonectria destructans]|nr:hypothetical protein EDB80DRAFT_373360 [Ilyonectria destructans]